jgi:serine phosphatase RsbU (regulator of sigma subunit)
VLSVIGALAQLRDAAPDQVWPVLEQIAAPLARDLVLYLVDFEQVVLLPIHDPDHLRLIPEEDVRASLAGRAFTTGRPVVATRDGQVRLWVPVNEHSERTGVLAMTVADDDPKTIEQGANLGVLAGLLVASAARYTDLMHARRLGRTMSLAASMQWRLLPPLTVRTPATTIAGLLEPAYEVAGDAFDYAVNGDRIDLAIFDAMGHGIGSSQLASLAVGGYRHARRNGETLPNIHLAIDDAINQQYAGDAFATGLLARLDQATGQLSWTNAGHPLPLLLRDRKVVGHLSCEPSTPFGLDDGVPIVATESLQPGDGVLLYTDGVVEARTPGGEEFGLHRLTDLLQREAAAETPPDEMLRRLIRTLVEHHGGELRDDATLVMLCWEAPTKPS